MKHNRNFMKKNMFMISLACTIANINILHAHFPAAAGARIDANAADKKNLEKGNIDQALAALKEVYLAHFSNIKEKKNLLSYIKKAACLYHLKAVELIVNQKKMSKCFHETAREIENDAWTEYIKNGGQKLAIEKYSTIMNQFIDVQTKILSQADCLGAISLLTHFQEYIKEDISIIGERPAIEEA